MYQKSDNPETSCYFHLLLSLSFLQFFRFSDMYHTLFLEFESRRRKPPRRFQKFFQLFLVVPRDLTDTLLELGERSRCPTLDTSSRSEFRDGSVLHRKLGSANFFSSRWKARWKGKKAIRSAWNLQISRCSVLVSRKLKQKQRICFCRFSNLSLKSMSA